MKIIIVSLAFFVCWVSCAPSSDPSTTAKPFVRLPCPDGIKDGYFVDSKDPEVFHLCSHGKHIATFHCQNHTVFDQDKQTCVLANHDHLKCPEPNGLFPYPGNLHKFIECFEGRAYVRTCASDLIFDDETDQCVFNDGNSPWPSDPTTEEPPTTHLPETTVS